MEKTLNIKIREDVDLIKATEYMSFLDCGASKSAFKKDDLCYKLPIGYEELNEYSFTKSCEYPTSIKDFNDFINNTVAYYNEAMVWSIGQIIFEIIIWENLKELEKEGYDISGFAAIKDYYIDKNGIPVIIQEYIETPEEYHNKDYSSVDFEDQNKDVLDALDERGFTLVDIRRGNMAYNQEGKLKLFDFGISRGSSIYDYDPYDEYNRYNSTYYSDEC